MIGLKKQIKDKDFRNLYLFYGSEDYLMNIYVDKMKKEITSKDLSMMNYDAFIADDATEEKISNAVETLPFMSEKRLIVVKDSKIFTSKGKASDSFIKLINNIPTTTVLIFVQQQVDKRSRLYKAIKKNGYIVEFNTLPEKEVVGWIQNNFKKNRKMIDYPTATYFLEFVGTDLRQLSIEIEKLCSFKLEATAIQKEDIEMITTKSIEAKIFDMVDALGMKKTRKAFELYGHLIGDNEPPMRIMFMITRQFRLILKTMLLLQEGFNQKQIAQKLKVMDFIVRKLISQGKMFSLEQVVEVLEYALMLEYSIKSGKIKDQVAVELLITKTA